MAASSALVLALLGLGAQTASAKATLFEGRTGAANPLNGQSVGSDLLSKPTLSDLDRDGDLDLVAGGHFVTFYHFENTGSATSPAFVPRTGAANPLNGQNVGLDATQTLGDLDGDGDPDVISGNLVGTFSTYSVPEPLRGLMLGAGIVLLRGLGRLRRGARRSGGPD